MNLLYLMGSLIGVALIVGLNVVLFGRTRPALGNDLDTQIAADVPGFRSGERVVGSDGATALVEDEAGTSIFLVRAFGNRIVTRKLSPGVLRRVRAEGSALSLQLKDFTLPGARIALDDEAVAQAWEARLKATAA